MVLTVEEDMKSSGLSERMHRFGRSGRRKSMGQIGTTLEGGHSRCVYYTHTWSDHPSGLPQFAVYSTG